MSNSLRQPGLKYIVAFAAAVLLFVGAAVAIVVAIRSVRSSAHEIDHAARTIAATNDLMVTMIEIETGQRGYQITGDLAFLQPYTQGLAVVDARMERLFALTSGDPQQRAEVRRVRQLAVNRIAFAKYMVQLEDSGRASEANALVRTGVGKRRMDILRRAIRKLRDRQLQLNDAARREAEERGRSATLVVLLAALVSLLAGGAAVQSLRKFRRSMREETERRDRLFEDTFEEAAVGIVHIAPDGHWLRANQQCSVISGYSREELLARQGQFATHPDDVADERLKIARLTAGEIDRYSHEKRVIRKGGEAIWVNSSVSLVRDAAGTPQYFVAVIQDISDRKRADELLRESEARDRAIIDSAMEAIAVIDHEGVIQSANPMCERVFGYAASELIGQNVSMLMPHGTAEQHDLYLTRYRQTGQRAIIGTGREVVGQRKDGTTVPLDLSVAEWQHQGHTFFTGIMRDISARKKTEAALRSSASQLRALQNEYAHLARVNELGEMAAAIAHEINQPLTAISNYLNSGLYATSAGFTEDNFVEAEEVMSQASAQALRAGEIVRRLREFIGKGTGDRRVESVDGLVDAASGLALIDAAANGILVERMPGAGNAQVEVDAVQIQQVVVNLVRNAVDSLRTLPPQQVRRLTIATRLCDDTVELRVSDNGPGVPSDMRDSIFKPFVTSKSNGMGMGLSVCRRLVEAHDGTLALEPEGGEGATFKVRLPRYEGDIAAD